MYTNVQGMSSEEKTKLKRQLRMEQMSLESNFKKLERKEVELMDQLHRFKQDRSRIEVQIEETTADIKNITDKKDFTKDEIRKLKKRLIELG